MPEEPATIVEMTMKVKEACARLRETSDGVLLDVTPEAAVFGLKCQTAISLSVEGWISRPEDPDLETAVTRFAFLMKAIVGGPAGAAVAEKRKAVFELNMTWIEPGQPSETTGFVVVCEVNETGDPSVVVLLGEDLTRVLH
jgi:hypothetical protein